MKHSTIVSMLQKYSEVMIDCGQEETSRERIQINVILKISSYL